VSASPVETSLRFSVEETAMLCTKNSSFYNASINEILLAALALSCEDVFGRKKFLIDHEGHGRHGLPNCDISRTIGWFTTLYPVLLESFKDPVATLLKTKEHLASFSRNDHLFSIARWVQKNPSLAQLHPEILFNYFGRVGDELTSGDMTSDAKENRTLVYNCEQIIGPTSHHENPLPHILEINAIVIDEQLRCAIVYNPQKVSSYALNLWKDCFKKHILNYIALKKEIRGI
jgi:non-ribosomal peptide synthase protein (TIGR01720 family)